LLSIINFSSKGLEIKGFLPVNVPRRPGQQGLLLEKYQFIPQNEEKAIELNDKNKLIEYIQVCCTLGQRLVEMSPKVNKLQMNGFKIADEEVVAKYVNKKDENTNQILLKIFNELESLKIDDNSNIVVGKDDKEVIQLETALKNIFDKPENDISLDYINSMFNSERFIRPSLDLVMENNYEKNLKVCVQKVMIQTITEFKSDFYSIE